ncbi:MAG: MBOAT family protein [Bacteroidales bacterium]|jgi:D-alanyl-lipoteichoic acid acyltransferase DltB (MBOAT superfamily)|nr:MBOAT family protein [Bacteroidales bacterium]
MLFNSFAFSLFLPIVFFLYWAFFSKSIVKRNIFLLACSYFFYGWWDWRFLSLIIISSLSDFIIGNKIAALNAQGEDETPAVHRVKKRWLMVSIITNIGLLGFFKYFNFFADSLVALLSTIGLSVSPFTLNIILPVGISFYTFQTLSYTIDIYRRQGYPTKDWVQFFTFVSFFPQLMAGPIERAKNLLPQFERLHTPDYTAFRNAMMQIAWGFFKKIMIADRLAVYVDSVFKDIPAASGFPMLLGAMFFSFQVYFDFSGYSDIAIGTARLFGFELRKNFNRPYLSTSFAGFWRRWHISLTSWLTDYVFTPIAIRYRNLGKWGISIAIFLNFLVSGLWHGADWTFVIFGAFNGLFIILLDPLLALSKTKNIVSHTLKSLFVWSCWVLSTIFFRAPDFHAALNSFAHLGFSHINQITNFGLNATELKLTFALIGIILLKEITCEWKDTWLQSTFFKLPALFRWAFYIAFVLGMVYFGQYGNGNENSFIYFQF